MRIAEKSACKILQCFVCELTEDHCTNDVRNNKNARRNAGFFVFGSVMDRVREQARGREENEVKPARNS
jgi:hypothetical protein